MAPVLREHHPGTATVPTRLVDEIGWVLDVDDGAGDWLTEHEAAAARRCLDSVRPAAADTRTVDAAALAGVRNVFDALTLSFEAECEDYGAQGNDCCNRCRWCEYLLMRDRIDVLLDAQGFHGGSRYEAYGRPEAGFDPEAIWREHHGATV